MSVLTLEFSRHSQSRIQHKNFPRSEVEQNLSVLVATVDWMIINGDGNYLFCLQARKMLQRILDKMLSPEPNSAISSRQIPTPSASGDDLIDWTFISLDFKRLLMAGECGIRLGFLDPSA